MFCSFMFTHTFTFSLFNFQLSRKTFFNNTAPGLYFYIFIVCDSSTPESGMSGIDNDHFSISIFLDGISYIFHFCISISNCDGVVLSKPLLFSFADATHPDFCHHETTVSTYHWRTKKVEANWVSNAPSHHRFVSVGSICRIFEFFPFFHLLAQYDLI